MGQEPCPGPKLKKWAEDAGFVNVQEHVFKIPMGPWPKDPKLVSKHYNLAVNPSQNFQEPYTGPLISTKPASDMKV